MSVKRSASGADKIAGRDALSRRKPKIADDSPSLSPPPKEAYYVVDIQGPAGRIICPARCELVGIAGWMESANNLMIAIGNPDVTPEFSALIPVIRGKQTIKRENFIFRELEQLDIVTFEVTKPTDFFLSAVFREL